ncbi:MAG: 50S ribosomal protein L4 [Candidatus Falkowbacteria bacterium]|nr:50S ribosomal protein L4 [Candidatus Falkowbacteria bacterium]
MSTTVKIYNQKAEVIGEQELSSSIFNTKMNEGLVHQAAVAQMANKRQVLAHTKGRAEVRGGGKKPWKQKGTGRARAGSSRSPIWVGGGVTIGPTKDRNFKKDISKKMKQKALFCVLTDKAHNGLIILDKFDKDLKKKKKRSFLLIDQIADDKIKKSINNLEGVELINTENINIIDLLKYKNLILTVNSIKILEDRYNKEVKEVKKVKKIKTA